MEYVRTLFGNTTPSVLPYQVGETMAVAGVPVVVGGAGNEGVALGDTTTGSVDLVGITEDTATLATAQSGTTDPSARVSVVIDPNAVYRARMLGGAAANTALTLLTVTTASTDGLTVTTASEWSSPTYDEGAVWCYSGANVSSARKITSVSSTAGTVTVAFTHDIAVGDRFLRAPFVGSPVGMEAQFVQLSTNLDAVDASVAVDTDNNNFRVVELLLGDNSNDGQNNSHVLLSPFDSIFAAGGSI